MARIKDEEIREIFTEVAEKWNLSIGKSEGQIFLKWADARIGNRVAIFMSNKNGGIHSVSSYYSPSQFMAFCDGVLAAK